MKNKTSILFAIILLTLTNAFAQSNKLETAKLVKPIEAYAKTIEDFVEQTDKPHMFFASVSDRKLEKTLWIEYDSVEAFEKADVVSYETVAVWKKDEKIVYASFAYSSESGDWVEYYSQTYRGDGTLAKLDRELRTFNGGVIVSRIKIFDKDGKLLSESISFRDLSTNKPLKESDANYMNVEAGTMYQKTSDLPFLSAEKNVTVSKTSYEIEEFIPKGWKLEYKTEGDLNGDKMPDTVLQLIQDEAEESEEAQRTLVILIQEYDRKFTKFAEAKRLLMCKGCGGMLGSGASIEIKNGILLISQMYGSREGTNFLLRFRYEPQSKRFLLIGEDVNNFDRGTGAAETTSTNYLTGKQIITKSKGGETDVTESVQRKRVPKREIYIEDVSYENY